ncbi:MAG TPA: hypothetical protein DCZ69_01845 [Syntrophobacteraceae bacterium]|nr:hypothetical protein [Syntrophobacteraceae bacterium]HBZ54987.1 hypothetical protein [Syntrophobacteraceae bacterium]
MPRLHDASEFFAETGSSTYYVGFLKSPQVWFPLAMVSDASTGQSLDTLCVARSCRAMQDIVRGYADRLEGVEQTMVQFLRSDEIRLLMEQYGLNQVAVIAGDEDEGSDAGCSCDCGCGCG